MPDDRAEMHRRLAVKHRRGGTPASRFLSILEIDAALRLDPENPLYHLEKGLTRYEQRFTGDAIRSLKKAAALDPGCFGAWYYLGLIHREAYFKTMCWEDDREAALLAFRRASAVDGRHAGAIFNLGLLMLLEGRIARALEYAASGERLHPDCERFPLLAGAAELQHGRFEQAERNFARALARMDQATCEEFEDISPLLAPDQRRFYLNLEGSPKLDYERKFWALHDPTPSSETNERLLEHYNRVFLARELLSLPRLGLPGPRTARGESLVRYGLPSTIRCDLGPGTDGPFVIWHYGTEDTGFMLFFQDEFLSGNYHIPIAPKYSRLAMITEGIWRGIPQLYTFPLDLRILTSAVQSAQTRGSAGATRLEFSIAVPDTAFSGPRERYRLALTVFDSELNRHRGAEKEIRSDTLAVLERSGALWRLMYIECELAPPILESTAALEIQGGAPEARALHRETLVIQDYSRRVLALGSVRINLTEGDGSCGDILDPLPVFGPGSVICAACDIFNLRPDRSQRAYYRVTYSIRRHGGDSASAAGPGGLLSALRTLLRGENETAPVISNTFERSTAGRDVYDRIAVDISTLEPGAYRLVVEVEDLVAKRRAGGERGFVVTD